MSRDTFFYCHYKGRFEVKNGITSYRGGEVHNLECPAESLFIHLPAALGVSLYGQRIWYKLPFEDMKDLKLLCNGSDNFQQMCLASVWIFGIDIFLEEDNVDVGCDVAHGEGNCSDDGHGNASCDDENRGNANVESEAIYNVDIGLDYEEGDTFEEDGRVDVEIGCDYEEGDTFEEDARVEENLQGYVDDEENLDYHDTPVNSDSEDVQRCQRYETWRKGSGQLKLNQVFDSIATFKEAVVEYVLKEQWNVKYTRWGSEKSEVKCTIGDGCPFKVYCSFEEPIGKFMIKTFDAEHTCIKDGSSKVLTGKVMAQMFLNDIRKDPNLRPRDMQDEVLDRYNLTVTHEICRKGKYKALQTLKKEYDEQFSRVKDYKNELLRCNKGSTVEIGTVIVDGEIERFDRFYVCFEVLKRTWLQHCRPIIGIDGCFLKSSEKGQLLAAVGRDANNQFYPVAWAVVQVENTDTWLWFMKMLQTDLKLNDGDGFTLISDRQKGLLIAADQLLPKVEHRMCARHIYGNLRSQFPGKSRLKPLFWAVAKSYNKADYDIAIEAVKIYDITVFEAMMEKNPKNCSRAFFKTTSTCEDVHNNFSESYNNAINKARSLPLVEMLETVRRQCMVRIDARQAKSIKHRGKYTPKVGLMIAEEEKELKYSQLIPAANGLFEVIEKGCSYALDLNARKCMCRRWQMTGIPCRHALKAIHYKSLNAEDYVSDWYLTSKWQGTYSDSIKPVNGMHFWRKSGATTIQPPEKPISQGKTKKQKRIREKHESPKKRKAKGKDMETQVVGKASRKNRTVHCGNCSLVGHNKRRCPTKSSSVQEMAESQGPSQSSQNS